MADKLLHMHDRLLGHVPRPIVSGAPVTIDGDGLRLTGDGPASSERPILAEGDSYTWGEDVGDLDAWPAELQRLLGRRVLNGGVTGYGFDQTVLWAERLFEQHKPAAVIVGFVPDDIGRTEMRRMWWHDKPWFALEDGELALRGVPVPIRAWRWPRLVRGVERVVYELSPVAQHVLGYNARAQKPGVGREIARRLTGRLAQLQARSQAKVIVMAQYDPRTWMSRALADQQRELAQDVLEGAAKNGMATVDTFARLAAESRPLEL